MVSDRKTTEKKTVQRREISGTLDGKKNRKGRSEVVFLWNRVSKLFKEIQLDVLVESKEKT